MNGHLMTLDGKEIEPTGKTVEDLLASSEPFWLDLRLKGEDSPEFALLRDSFHFHPLALEDAAQFGQRAKLDSYDDFAFLVVFGPGHGDHLVEMHCFSAQNFLVTVHRRGCPATEEVRHRLQAITAPLTSPVMVLYRVVDMLVDDYFPVLAKLDDEIDDLEDEILQAPTDEQLGRLFDMKRSLIVLRKVVTPERDLFATLVSSSDVIPGMTPEYERYFRDVYDHLIRVSDLVDSYRDLLSGALDTHLSTVSNRLNVVMKQLTIIATVFLPLSFLTGFFGQNYAWMISKITSAPAFWGVGVGSQIVVAVGLLIMFRRRGWLSSDGTVPAAVPAKRTRPMISHMRWLALHPIKSLSTGGQGPVAATGAAGADS
ncbi:MAG TPA: magnesium transporter CorA family protein [Acidimicrobiales bacterium]|nr:magnesium transporter CorA family protein [Acidimicrobiales bacterium]